MTVGSFDPDQAYAKFENVVGARPPHIATFRPKVDYMLRLQKQKRWDAEKKAKETQGDTSTEEETNEQAEPTTSSEDDFINTYTPEQLLADLASKTEKVWKRAKTFQLELIRRQDEQASNLTRPQRRMESLRVIQMARNDFRVRHLEKMPRFNRRQDEADREQEAIDEIASLMEEYADIQGFESVQKTIDNYLEQMADVPMSKLDTDFMIRLVHTPMAQEEDVLEELLNAEYYGRNLPSIKPTMASLINGPLRSMNYETLQREQETALR